jgi:hypothetical protein
MPSSKDKWHSEKKKMFATYQTTYKEFFKNQKETTNTEKRQKILTGRSMQKK